MSKSDTPENRVKTEVMKYLKLRRIYCWSNPSGAVRVRPGKFMSFGKKGSADIIGLLAPDGKFLAVETKAPDGRLSPEQKQFLAGIREQGGGVIPEVPCRNGPGNSRGKRRERTGRRALPGEPPPVRGVG
jgi:hypothetical protein